VYGPKRTCRLCRRVSAFGGKADLVTKPDDVAFATKRTSRQPQRMSAIGSEADANGWDAESAF
jgi:hypothetical protein